MVGKNFTQPLEHVGISFRFTMSQKSAEQVRRNSRPTFHEISGQAGAKFFVPLMKHRFKQLLRIENASQGQVGQEGTDILLHNRRRAQGQLIQQGHEPPDINRAAGFVLRRA